KVWVLLGAAEHVWRCPFPQKAGSGTSRGMGQPQTRCWVAISKPARRKQGEREQRLDRKVTGSSHRFEFRQRPRNYRGEQGVGFQPVASGSFLKSVVVM